MKSTLFKNKQSDTKQRVNELVNPGSKSQSVTLYNADSTDYLSQKSRTLHALLQKINEIEFCVETTSLCLRPMQDLLDTGKTLLQNYSTTPDPDLWSTYAGLFTEFTNQIEQITAEATFEDKNLLQGDTLTLIFEENESYNFQIKGRDLSALARTLRELSSEEPLELEQLHYAHDSLEVTDKAIEALSVLLKGSEAVLKSKKVFTQKLLRQTVMKLNTLKYALHEDDGIETPRFQSLTNLIGQTQYQAQQQTKFLPGITDQAIPGDESAEDNIYNFTDSLETDNASDEEPESQPEPTLHLSGPAQEDTPVLKTEVLYSPEPKKITPERRENQEEEKGFSSLFPLFRSGRKGKDSGGPGIRTILDRLHIAEPHIEQQSEVPKKEEEENTPFKVTTGLDKLCQELLYNLDSKQIPFLEERFQKGETKIYAEALGLFMKEHKEALKKQYAEDKKLQELMNRFEQIFHELVKENYRTNPDNRDKFIREWLNSPYGAAYKIIFSLLKGKV